MRAPGTNAALLVLVPLALVTGLLGLLGGALGGPAVFLAHAVAGYAIVVLLAPKWRIARGALRRPARDPRARRAFLAMAGLLIWVLASGIAWAWLGPLRLGGITVINWHAYAAVALAVLLALHVPLRWQGLAGPRSRDRAAVLRLVGATAAGAALVALDRAVEGAAGRDVRRRFTGSHLDGAPGARFPSVSWLDDDPAPIDPARWSLAVRGAVARPLALGLVDLAALPAATRRATLDCTGGWYTLQDWTGVPLAAVLDAAGVLGRARSVRVVGVTGYARRFPLADAHRLLLATAVGGAPLSHGHGAPLRLVAPGARGFAWVKWIVALEVDETPAWWQPPLPLT